MAAPIPFVTVSTTSGSTTGVAPLGVFFDATGTTDADTTNPFHDLLYVWNFGDNSSSTWSYGSNLSASKNLAFGAVVAHVYEQPGTYTWSMVCYDGTSAVLTTGTITVTNANTVFSGTNTIAVSSTALPVAGVDGVPAGASCQLQTSWATVCGYVASGKRVLLKAGDVWDVTAHGIIAGNVTAMLSSYGTENNGRAIVRVNASTPPSNGWIIQGSGNDWQDFRITSIEFDGNGQTTALVGTQGDAWLGFLAMNNYIHDIGDGWNQGIDSDVVIVCDETIETIIGGSGTHAFAVPGARVALLGSNLAHSEEAEHPVRIPGAAKVVISNNHITDAPNESGPAGTKETVAIRSDQVDTPSLYVLVSQNYIDIRGYAGVTISSGALEPLNQNIIIDKNQIVSAAGATGFQNNAQKVTVRNNIFDMTLASGPVFARINDTSDGQNSENVWVYNNTLYSSAVSGGATGVLVEAGCLSITVKNNLQYTPNVGGTNVFLSNAAGGQTTASNNTGNTGAVTTDPAFDGPLSTPTGYRISTSSYGANGGTAIYPPSNNDFFNADDVTANEHMGACVSRVRASAKGVAS